MLASTGRDPWGPGRQGDHHGRRPGAGKSRAITTAQQALGPAQANRLGLDEAGFNTIDADDVKQLLLGNPITHLPINPSLLNRARHHWDRLIQRETPHQLADGTPLLRGELDVLVHRFSNTISEHHRLRTSRRHATDGTSPTLVTTW